MRGGSRFGWPLFALWLLTGLSGCNSFHGLQGALMTDGAASSLHQHLAVGRLDIAVPHMTPPRFSTTEVSDCTPLWSDLAPAHDLDGWVAERKRQIQAGKLSDGRTNALIRAYSVDNVPLTIYWDLPNTKGMHMEGYRKENSRVFIVNTDAYENEIPGGQADILSLLSSFHPEEQGTRVKSGFAIDGGVLDRPFHTNEETRTSTIVSTDHVPESLNLKLEVATKVYNKSAPSTIPDRRKRANAIIAATAGVHISELRFGERTVAGLKGWEWVNLTRSADDLTQYGLTLEFEYGGDARNPNRPYTQITLGADEIPTSQDRTRILALWDAMLQTATFHP